MFCSIAVLAYQFVSESGEMSAVVEGLDLISTSNLPSIKANYRECMKHLITGL